MYNQDEVKVSNPSMSLQNDISQNDSTNQKVITMESIRASSQNKSVNGNKEVSAITLMSPQKDISIGGDIGILDVIRARVESSVRNEQSEIGVEPTDFEKQLFVGNTVDFESYIECNALFKALNTEALCGVDVRYANYQHSLVHLLQHCYGYFYTLKKNSERYETDIKEINSAIAASNLRSNKNNSLSTKIVKLAWKGTKIDRRRIYNYSKLLDNAWCKGKVDSYTDKDGCMLPKFFSEAVMIYGGISSFSRMSQSKVESQHQLEKEGYKNNNEKSIDVIRDAIKNGEFVYNDKRINITCPHSLPSNHAFSKKFRDGERVCLLVKWDLEKEEFKLVYHYSEDNSDGVVDKAELELYKILKDACLKRK